MFEAPGIRDSQKSSSPKTRINRSRYVWFGNYMQSRRQPHSLADFVANDDLYSSATLDAYSEGWALTFFLAETRHASYGHYLKLIVQRNPLKPTRPTSAWPTSARRSATSTNSKSTSCGSSRS